MTEPKFARGSALLLACTVACTGVWAQSVPPSAAAASAAERAQRETDRTMYWIRVLATKPAVAKAPPAPAPAVALAAPAPRPVPAVAPVAKATPEAREKIKVAATAPAPSPARGANAPVQVALADPAPAPDAPYPSALSSPSADKAATTGAPLAMPAPPEPAQPVAAEEDPGLSQINLVQPDFPTMVVKRVRKGNVEVRFEVEPGGTVSEAVVVESSNHRLDAAAIDAIKQWRFKPTPMYHTAAVNLVFDIDKE